MVKAVDFVFEVPSPLPTGRQAIPLPEGRGEG